MSIYKTSPVDWDRNYPGVLADAYKTCSVRTTNSSDYKPCCVDSCKRVCPTATGKGCQSGWRNDNCATNLNDDECSSMVKSHFNPPKPVNAPQQYVKCGNGLTLKQAGIVFGILMFLLLLYILYDKYLKK